MTVTLLMSIIEHEVKWTWLSYNQHKNILITLVLLYSYQLKTKIKKHNSVRPFIHLSLLLVSLKHLNNQQ